MINHSNQLTAVTKKKNENQPSFSNLSLQMQQIVKKTAYYKLSYNNTNKRTNSELPMHIQKH